MTRCFLAKGAHNTRIDVCLQQGECFECKKEGAILAFDNSDREYTSMNFCMDCLREFSRGFISSSNFGNDLS